MSFAPSSADHPAPATPTDRGGFCALFPGQGAQAVGMGRTLYDSFAVARAVFEEASDAISLDLKRLCFEGPEDALTLTHQLQPALLTVSIAAYRVAERERGFRPVLAAGHSLGEYSALVASGAIELAQAVRWVRARGQAMQSAVPAGEGGMSAVLGCTDEQAIELANLAQELARSRLGSGASRRMPVCEAANFNAPAQVVLSGTLDALACLPEAARSRPDLKAKLVALPVSAPFHCSLMQPAREHMQRLFRAPEVRVGELAFAYLPNRTARATRERSVVLGLLEEQIDHPVLWRTSMERAFASGISRFVEFGPGRVLSGLLKRIQGALPEPGPTLEVIQMSGPEAVEFIPL